jgi:two-component sensor histidine kinase
MQDNDNHATLSVEDDGIGVADDFCFERSDTLGAQLVYLLAGQLAGTVSFTKSAPTGFAVRFPLSP